MKKKVILASLTLIAILGLFYGTVQAKTLAPGLKVGVLISYSGPISFAASYQRVGVELAIQDLQGKVAVSANYIDVGDNDAETKAQALKIKNLNADLIFAPLESEKAKRALRYLSKEDLIAVSALDESLGNGNLFRLASTTSQDSYVLAHYIAQQNPKSVAVISADDDYSRLVGKSVAFGLAMRGISGVSSLDIDETKVIRSNQSETVVLSSMEQSVSFFERVGSWITKRTNYLVPGNLANYSMFDWSRNLEGSLGLIAFDEVPQAFRQRVASKMAKPELLSTPNSPMFGIAKRTYDAVMLAAEQLRGDGAVDLGQWDVFNKDGYYQKQKYTVVRYSKFGTFAPIGVFDPKKP
ncbi:MAG: amino acid ABC transporter substrate-binding protein [Microbacteriaceae bacterium]|nr:amino acid ABC transporter substrate-binding protein [Microbacteriaceae bacterium]